MNSVEYYAIAQMTRISIEQLLKNKCQFFGISLKVENFTCTQKKSPQQHS